MTADFQPSALLRGLKQSLFRSAPRLPHAVRLLRLLPDYMVTKCRRNRCLMCEYEFKSTFCRSRVLLNVNSVPSRAGMKRALLVYTVHPFFHSANSDAFVSHTNLWRSREISKILDELGYIVDVMHYTDHDSNVKSRYDLLLGFGRATQLAREMPCKTVKVFLATGSEGSFQNQREMQRVADVNRRRNCCLQVKRRNPMKSELLEYFDAIICLGTEVTAETYRPYYNGSIHCFNNHGYDELMGMPKGKDFAEARRHFLFFGSRGQVLFGLDLLLEVFAIRPHLSLYVCGPFENDRDFARCYESELYESGNIVPVGWVRVGGPKYKELTRRCSTVIVPICAGASTGSVIVCMGSGLIPIVTKEAGIDTNGFGITLPSYRIDDIGRVVDWIANQPASWHEEMSLKTLNAARRDFSQAAFSKRFRNILREVIASKARSSPQSSSFVKLT